MRAPPVPPTRRGLVEWARAALGLAGRRGPLRRLGQHFLADPAVVRAFRRELEAWAGRDFLEVGVGPGTLAFYLSDLPARLRACELDASLARVARSILPGNVLVTVEDGLKAVEGAVEEVVYSNTPYSISSQLVAAAARNNRVRVLVLMVQKEVALRLAADPGSPDYGRLTIVASRFFRVSVRAVFGPRSFYPPPEVDSALVVLERVRQWRSGVDDVIEDLARCLFTQRNRLAVRVAERCVGGRLGPELEARLGSRRVRELTHEDLEALAGVATAYTRSRRTRS